MLRRLKPQHDLTGHFLGIERLGISMHLCSSGFLASNYHHPLVLDRQDERTVVQQFSMPSAWSAPVLFGGTNK